MIDKCFNKKCVRSLVERHNNNNITAKYKM